VAGSALFAGAFENTKMIGMGRALSDQASDAYIQDVAVLKEFQGRGIGKKIIQTLIAGLNAWGVDWIGLIAEPGTTGFYEELGFELLEGHVPLKLKDPK
jgi:ribosomal protein S18 acetylase RimI-like enzyme